MIWFVIVLAVLGAVGGVAWLSWRCRHCPSVELDPMLEARAEVALHRIHVHREEASRKAAMTRRAQLARRMMHADMAASRHRRGMR